VVVEEFLDGPEFSLFVVCDGTVGRPLLPAQDFKRIFDGGRGPNTGGMGSYAPLTWLPDGIVESVMADVVVPTLAEMQQRGAPFVGCLYVGLALTAAGPKVIEFNCRFGDPDVQPVLALLTSPLGTLLRAAADGDLTAVPAPTFAEGASVSVVMASAGYPEGSSSGDVIVGTETLAVEDDVDVIHAGTARVSTGSTGEGSLVTAGGRVLAVRATGSDVADARAKAYEGISSISFPGAQWRRDIAAEPLGVVEGAASRG
jgi:phosphoribosylamine--glycine ligase